MSIRIATLALVGLAAFAFCSLLFGARYLEAELPGGLPAGNALVAVGLCSLAGTSIMLSPHGTRLRKLSCVALFASLCWLPGSIALAGNVELNFGGGGGDVWLGVSLGVVLLVFSLLAWAVGLRLASLFKRVR